MQNSHTTMDQPCRHIQLGTPSTAPHIQISEKHIWLPKDAKVHQNMKPLEVPHSLVFVSASSSSSLESRATLSNRASSWKTLF